MKLLSRFSEQTDVNIDMSTDSCITEEEVFTRVFHFVIVMATMMMLGKAVRLILWMMIRRKGI